MTTRVLVVDSHERFRHDLVRYLTLLGSGYEVIAALGSAAEALDRIDALRPDIVLIELALPDSNGLLIARLIRDLWPAIAVVVLSTNAAAAYNQAAQDGEGVGYIDKMDLVKQLPDTLARITAVTSVESATAGQTPDR